MLILKNVGNVRMAQRELTRDIFVQIVIAAPSLKALNLKIFIKKAVLERYWQSLVRVFIVGETGQTLKHLWEALVQND